MKFLPLFFPSPRFFIYPPAWKIANRPLPTIVINQHGPSAGLLVQIHRYDKCCFFGLPFYLQAATIPGRLSKKKMNRHLVYPGHQLVKIFLKELKGNEKGSE